MHLTNAEESTLQISPDGLGLFVALDSVAVVLKALIRGRQKPEFDKVIQCYLGTVSYSRPKALQNQAVRCSNSGVLLAARGAGRMHLGSLPPDQYER